MPNSPKKPPAAPGLCLKEGELVGERPHGEQPESGEGRNGDLGSAEVSWPAGGWYW